MHDRLRQARKNAGFETATDAARSFQWKAPTYTAHENGTRGVPFEAVVAYADAFNTDASWIAFGVSPKESKIGDVPTSVLREILLLVLEADGAKKATPEQIASLVIEICQYVQKSGRTGLSSVVDFEMHRLARRSGQ